MQHVFPAHHRKRIARLLEAALADLAARGIDTSGKTALEIFSLRAAERQRDRTHSIAAKAKRAGGYRRTRLSPRTRQGFDEA